jgi:hypothetical protein
MYTDDFFVFGSRAFVEDETARFADDAESVVGADAINVKKTIAGTDIDIIGLANDTTATHSIGMSSTIFLKMVCATYVMMPMDVKVGDLVSVKTLQSVASRALRCADVVHVMAPYSRGFSANLRGIHDGVEMVPLTQRAYTDLWMWRVAMNWDTKIADGCACRSRFHCCTGIVRRRWCAEGLPAGCCIRSGPLCGCLHESRAWHGVLLSGSWMELL